MSRADCYECAAPSDRAQFMICCPDCGNKRCPKSTFHGHACTGSNEFGQAGSRYSHSYVEPAAVSAALRAQLAEVTRERDEAITLLRRWWFGRALRGDERPLHDAVEAFFAKHPEKI